MPLLEYTTVVPTQGSPSRTAVLMLLHGVGSNEQNMIPLAQGADERLAVISVRAPLAMGPGAYAWFPVQFTAAGPVLDAAAAERSRGLLLEFIDQYKAEHGVQEVYLMGFSQGAIMAAVAALSEPEKVRGAVCLSGRYPVEFQPTIAPQERLGATALFVSHGVLDEKLPIRHGRATRDLLSGLATDFAYREFDAGHTITPEMHAAAHAWLAGRVAQIHTSA
jgi:phospholipase/carboxylesterase